MVIDLERTEQELRKWFLDNADITNFEKGYICVRGANQLINTEQLKKVAQLTANYYKDEKFDYVAGVPNSGVYLATAVALEMGISEIVSTRKGNTAPGAWKQPMSFCGSDSYTTGEKVNFIFCGMREGTRVLLGEDVLASGYTLRNVIKECRRRNIEPSVAAYFSKTFQSGERLMEDLGVRVFSAIRIDSISKIDEISYRINLEEPYFKTT